MGTDEISEDEVLRFLNTRQGLLEGVAITGGEPLLSKELPDFLRKIKALGFKTKVDTNGSFPEKLRSLIGDGLVDYVAMDVKNSPEKYAETAGSDGMLDNVRQSVALLMNSAVPYEFRTTVVDELHEPSDFEAIGKWLKGAQRYFLQGFVDSGDVLRPGLHAASKEKMEQCLAVAGQYIPSSQIRGL